MSRPSRPASPRDADNAAALLGPEDAGAVQIGATDQGMVRLIVTTAREVVELDYAPEDAREIAEELLAASEAAEAAPSGRDR